LFSRLRLTLHPGAVALALGVVAACGFEPLRFWPLGLLAIAGLLELVSRASGWKQTAWIGWLFGLGHFTLGNNWIATAFTYQANMPAWLGWCAVVALACYLAVYPMLAAVSAWWLARGDRIALIPAFAGSWIVAEWMRAWVFTGFAWNPLAMVALGDFQTPGLAAAAPWLGTYALSGLVVLLAGFWLLALVPGRPMPWRIALAAIPVLAMVAPWTLPVTPSVGGMPYTLVQPDIRQDDLNDPDNFSAQFEKTVALSKPRISGQRRLVFWPESGAPYYMVDGYPRWFYFASDHEADPVQVRRRIGREIGPGGMLLTGAVDLVVSRGEAVGARNVITAVDADGRIAGSYAKAHLVPYGEYLPLRWLLEPLGAARLVPGSLDFLPGPGPRTLDLGAWGRAGMQICYEIVFSGEVVDRANRPDFIFNPSNDGWFGAWGPPQHLAQARLRAIEEGLPVLRATTTGISAVIDANGRVVQHVQRHEAGRLDGIIPSAFGPTPFSRAGNMLPLGWAAVLIAATLVAMRRRRS